MITIYTQLITKTLSGLINHPTDQRHMQLDKSTNSLEQQHPITSIPENNDHSSHSSHSQQTPPLISPEISDFTHSNPCIPAHTQASDEELNLILRFFLFLSFSFFSRIQNKQTKNKF